MSIGDYTFQECSELKSITIPNSVTTIGDYTFRNCSRLQSITIGGNFTSIGSHTFEGCNNLTSIVWNVKHYTDFIISDNLFYYNDGNNGRSDFDLRSQITSFEFGDSVQYIPGFICNGMKNLRSIIIPQNVISIGSQAFSYSGLISVIIGENITSLGASTFYGCESLTSVIWNAKKSIDFTSSKTPFYYESFDLRSQITTFEFGDSVQHIPAYLCYDMKNLTSITIPQNVTSIGERAFGSSGLTSVIWNAKKCNHFTQWNDLFIQGQDYRYSNLYQNNSIKTIVFGNDVECIPDFLCAGLRGLTSLTFSNSIKEIGWYAFERCSKLTNVIIPNSVTTLGGGAFYECSNLTSVTLPNSVTSIGDGPFILCEKLLSPVYNDKIFAFLPMTYQGEYAIPDGITTVVGFAFAWCAVNSIMIPQTVNLIGGYAFEGCSDLEKITCLATTPPTVDENTFCEDSYYNRHHYSSVALLVPKNSVSTYKETDYWKEFYKIEAINTTDIENILTDQTDTRKVLENGVMYILRDGEKYTIDGRKVM